MGIDTASTDASGNYSLSHVVGGSYHVRFSDGGPTVLTVHLPERHANPYRPPAVAPPILAPSQNPTPDQNPTPSQNPTAFAPHDPGSPQ